MMGICRKPIDSSTTSFRGPCGETIEPGVTRDTKAPYGPWSLNTSSPINTSLYDFTMAATNHQKSSSDINVAAHDEQQLSAGYEDPHKAALEDNPEHAEKLSLSVVLSALFLGTSFTGPIIFGFILATPILVQLSEILGGSSITFWVPSGWAAAAAVGFPIAGRLSDIFGRRYVVLVGQILTIIGSAIAASAHSMNQLIAGEVILGASIGTVSVAYAGRYHPGGKNVNHTHYLQASPRSYPTSGAELAWRGPNLTLPAGPLQEPFLRTLSSLAPPGVSCST